MSKPIRAIVILYHGDELPVEASATIATMIRDHYTDGTSPVISLLSPEDIAKRIVGDIPMQNDKIETPEVAHAIAIIGTLIPDESKGSQLAFRRALTKLAIKAIATDNETYKDVIEAMKVLAKDKHFVRTKKLKEFRMQDWMFSIVNEVYTTMFE